MPAGTLYLLPTPLGPQDDPGRVLPAAAIEPVLGLDYVVAEHARSARAVLGRLPMRLPLQSIEIRELNLHTPPDALPGLLAPLREGRDAVLLSEAGAPAIADPGAALVALAHREGFRVVPLVGPSAILLALMASGMNGQRFAFAGYAPVDEAARVARLRALEQRSAREDETELLIETPYRNQALFDAMLRTLAPDTLVGVFAELTLAGESVAVHDVAHWRRAPPVLARAPTVFTLQAAPRPPKGTASTARRSPAAAPAGVRKRRR